MMNKTKLLLTGLDMAYEIQRLIEVYPELKNYVTIQRLVKFSNQWMNEFNGNKEVSHV
jgi:hypothetical protein